ncbi:MAG: hypothetical protein K5663_09945 [Clostridiales bacterium]|nr:hypothetical protein [Clostridiales bacterium]
MRKVFLAESTLSLSTGMSFGRRLECARLLDGVNVDVICVCPAGDDKSDEILIKTIARQTQNAVVSVPVSDGEIDKAFFAVKDASRPRLNIKYPVSVVGMEYTMHLKPEKMLARISETIKRAKALCPDVEFTALDATRSDKAFLEKALISAKDAGANTLTLSDEAGEMLPDEFGKFVASVREYIGETMLGVIASDRLSMAEACAFEAVRAGADLIYTRCAPGTLPRLDIMVDLISARGESVGVCAEADVTALKQTAQIIAANDKANDPETAIHALPSAGEPKTLLTAQSDIQAVARAASLLGYDLSKADIAKVYERFMGIAVKKPVEPKELDAIIAAVALQVPPTYTLASYVVNSGNIITATAHVVLDRQGARVEGISTGDGPIDAAFLAIEKLIGHHYELDDFSIRAVTGGQEAAGEALVRLRDEGRLFSGRGISTDIVGAAIRAYINALNKIVYREN